MNNEMQNKVDKSVAILRKLYPEEEVGIEVAALEASIAAEKGDKMKDKVLSLIKSPELRPAVVAGVGLSANHYYHLGRKTETNSGIHSWLMQVQLITNSVL